jgi:hypothetical protein
LALIISAPRILATFNSYGIFAMKKHTIFTPHWGEQEWHIERTEHLPQDMWGICDWAEKCLKIHKAAKNKIELVTILHELFHAMHPHFNDDYIDRIAHCVASVLWKEGYRR